MTIVGTLGELAAAPGPAATTLAAANLIGSNRVSVTASVAVGALVRIRDVVSGSGFRGNTYTVRAVSGSGPFTVELDRPVLYQFGAADPFELLSEVPTGIRILGNGMRVTGTGSRLLEFLGARHCLVADVRFTPDAGMASDLVASFDVLGYDNEYSHCEVDGGNVASVGLAFETQERSRMTRGCSAHHCTGIGIALYDSVACVVDGAHAWGNDNGLSITADGNDIGCVDTIVRGGSYCGNAQLGIGVHNGSRSTRIVDVCTRDNDVNLQIGDGDSAVADTFVQGQFDRAKNTAVTIVGAARSVLDVDVSNSAVGASFGAGTDVEIRGLTFRGATAALPTGRVLYSEAVRVRAARVTSTAPRSPMF